MRDRTFYSWLDIEFVLEQLRAGDRLPDWLLGYTAYQTELELRVLAGTSPGSIDEFLDSNFGARYTQSRIALESVPHHARSLEVRIDFESVTESSTTVRKRPLLLPSFRRMAAFPAESRAISLPPGFSDEDPQVTAFYSFKGGVGRTTHLLAYLKAIAESGATRATLVIDADLEAPGITYLFARDKANPEADFSLLDLLGVLQSDKSSGWEETLELASYMLIRQRIQVDPRNLEQRHYFLPAFRSKEQALTMDVRPEHLIRQPGQAWALTNFIAALGRKLGVDVVLLDLRTGFSELSSPFLFDSRIKRMLVTTPSTQSVDGIGMVLEQLGKLAKRDDSNALDPTLVVSLVLQELVNSSYLENIVENLRRKYPDMGGEDSLGTLQVVQTAFSQELLYFSTLGEVFAKLDGTNVLRSMVELVEFDLPSRPITVTQYPVVVEEVRRNINKLAEDLEYAESGKGEKFLKIAALRAIARQYKDATPSAVVIGAKGAGKTYTFLQLLRAGDWRTFVSQVTSEEGARNGILWPFLYSRNLDALALKIVNEARGKARDELSLKNIPNNLDLIDLIRADLQGVPKDETYWRHRWFELLSYALGLKPTAFNAAASELIETLRSANKNLVVMIDGLEDLFPDLANNLSEQVALRALIQGVPSYLREVPDSPLGVLIFVRADLARAAVTQNYGQFARLYDAFALHWNEEEALRLAVWLADEAGMERPLGIKEPAEVLSVDEAREVLFALWGRKLGTERSREARSAEWVLAALSDFRGQIQARDLVRFLHFAAQGSIGGANQDRVLMPNAVREAIRPCSLRKIEEIKQEIPQLNSVFAKLQQIPDLRIPFDAGAVGLNADEIRFLERVGVLAEDRGQYYIAEIFRFGLGFRLAEGARPKVLSLAKRGYVPE